MKPIKLIKKGHNNLTWESDTWSKPSGIPANYPAFSCGAYCVNFDLTHTAAESCSSDVNYKNHKQEGLAKWILKELNARIKDGLPFTREYLDAMIKVIKNTDNAFEEL